MRSRSVSRSTALALPRCSIDLTSRPQYINKARCVKQHATSNILQERRLLEEIDHPFVCNLRYAFQDDENCFFVLDLMLGGDLRCASPPSLGA